MKIYTDLHKRTKMYNLPAWGIDKLEKNGLEVVTKYSDDIEIYWGDSLTKTDVLNPISGADQYGHRNPIHQCHPGVYQQLPG